MPRRLGLIVIGLIVFLLFGGLFLRHLYNVDLGPVSNDQTAQLFTIEPGSSVKLIANNLQKDRLIRSAWAFELYAHGKNLSSRLQAGTYALSPSESSAQIITTLTKGKTSKQLITILPGKRIDQIRAGLINDGFAPTDVDAALNPATYSDLPALALKPTNVATLEGLLWPDSFEKDVTSSASDIIRQSLHETAQHMTADVQAAFAAEGLTPYQGLILTSIITQEVAKQADQPQVAQVFLSRLKINMMLGSDVTAIYGAVSAGKPPILTYDSPYNTLIHTGLPPTPISNVTINALAAATHPASTNWLYFVAGDDGITHFSSTLQEHQALTQKYCHKLCGQ